MSNIKVLSQEDIDRAFVAAKENEATEEQLQIVHHWAMSNYWKYRRLIEGAKYIVECNNRNKECCKSNDED